LYQNLAEKRLGRLQAELAYADIEEIMSGGLHEFLDSFQTKLNHVGEAIAETFFTLVDQVGTFRKMTVYERPGDRVIVLLSAGNLAVTQAVVSLLEHGVKENLESLLTIPSLYQVACLVGETLREVHKRAEIKWGTTSPGLPRCLCAGSERRARRSLHSRGGSHMTLIVMSACRVAVAPVPRKMPVTGEASRKVGPAASAMCRSPTTNPRVGS
jgi:hypothetical protein